MKQHFVSGFPCVANGGSKSIGNGDRVDGIGIHMVEHKNVMIATTGRSRKFSGLIPVGFEKVAFGKKSSTELMGAWFKMRCNVGVCVTRGGGGAEQWETG